MSTAAEQRSSLATLEMDEKCISGIPAPILNVAMLFAPSI
jgi:hypothetical protein